MTDVRDGIGKLTERIEKLTGWSTAQEALQKLAQQQELLDRAAHFGQLVGLMCMVAVALYAGRLWEVHLVSFRGGSS